MAALLLATLGLLVAALRLILLVRAVRNILAVLFASAALIVLSHFISSLANVAIFSGAR